MTAGDPSGRIDQNGQAQTIAEGGSGQTRAHRVGIAASTEEGIEEDTDKLGDHMVSLDGLCNNQITISIHPIQRRVQQAYRVL